MSLSHIEAAKVFAAIDELSEEIKTESRSIQSWCDYLTEATGIKVGAHLFKDGCTLADIEPAPWPAKRQTQSSGLDELRAEMSAMVRDLEKRHAAELGRLEAEIERLQPVAVASERNGLFAPIRE